MLDRLDEILYSEVFYKSLQFPDEWDSLVINRGKPETLRFIKTFGSTRVCLHRFSPCNTDESIWHPHAWPAAFLILEGKYQLDFGYSFDRFSEPENVSTCVMATGSSYEMINPLVWHRITPLNNSHVFTIMVNEEPFKEPHSQIRTTVGKDLLPVEDKIKLDMMKKFFDLIKMVRLNKFVREKFIT